MSEVERFTVESNRSVSKDLDDIVDYLVSEGAIESARALVDNFQRKVVSLKRFPRRGSMPKELEGLVKGEVRQLLMTPYRLIYEIVDDRVILRLFVDGRRDMEALLGQRLPKSGEVR